MPLFTKEEQRRLSRRYLKRGLASIVALLAFFVVFLIVVGIGELIG